MTCWSFPKVCRFKRNTVVWKKVLQNSGGEGNCGSRMSSVDPKINLSVVWTPGMAHPSHKHIHAADTEGSWYPDPGFAWVDSKLNMDVVWTKGIPHPTIKHICAGETEGTWNPEPGYNWLRPDENTNLDVVWTPGMGHPQFKHVFAYKDEGQWIPEPGFQFVNPTKDLGVVASPPKTPYSKLT